MPVFNNAETIAELVKRIERSLLAWSYEVIFVNDGSTDGSLQELRHVASADSRVRVIDLSRNFGQHPAIAAGFKQARGAIVILMDADLQDDPAEIPRLIAGIADGFDIVYTRRVMTDSGVRSRLTSKLYHFVFARIINAQVPADIGTFRAFSRKVCNALLTFEEYNILFGPMMLWMGYRVNYVSVSHNARPVGKSSYSFGRRLSLAVNSLVSYTDVPYRIFSVFGATIFIGAIVYATVVFVRFALFGRNLPDGVTLLAFLIAASTGGLMMCMGILGVYQFRVFQEVLRRPRYLVSETINFEVNDDADRH